MGSVRYFRLPPSRTAIARQRSFASPGCNRPTRKFRASRPKFSAARRIARPPISGIRFAYSTTSAWHLVAQTFPSVHAADAHYVHDVAFARHSNDPPPISEMRIAHLITHPARHLVAQTFLSVHAAAGFRLPFPVTFSPAVALAPSCHLPPALASGPQLSGLAPCLTI